MNISEESYGQAVILICSGEMTEDSLDVFKKAVERHLDRQHGDIDGDESRSVKDPAQNIYGSASTSFRDLVLNLEAVPFIDSVALEYLLDLQEQFIERLGQIKLVRMNEDLAKIFEITRLDSAFERFEDVSEAVKAI